MTSILSNVTDCPCFVVSCRCYLSHLDSGEPGLERRCHAHAKQFDGTHQRRVRQCRKVHPERQSRDATKNVVEVTNLVDDLIRATDDQRTMRADFRVEMRASDRSPAALATSSSETLNVAGSELVDGLLPRGRHVPSAWT